MPALFFWGGGVERVDLGEREGRQHTGRSGGRKNCGHDVTYIKNKNNSKENTPPNPGYYVI